MTKREINVEQRISALTNNLEAAAKLRNEYSELLFSDTRYDGPVRGGNGLGIDFDGFVTDVRQQASLFKNPIAMFANYENWQERNDTNRDILGAILRKSQRPIDPATGQFVSVYDYKKHRYSSAYPFPTWEEFVLEHYGSSGIEGPMKKKADAFVVDKISGRYIDFTQDPQYTEQIEALKEEVYEVLMTSTKDVFNRVRNAVLDITDYVRENNLWYAFVTSVEKELTQGWMYKLPDKRPKFGDEQFAEAKIEKAGEQLVNKIIDSLEKHGIVRPSEFANIHVRISSRNLISTFYRLVRYEYLSHNSQELPQ